MELNIMTWNTQLYEYGNKVDGKIKELNYKNFNSIIEVIKKYMDNNINPIVALQEIPYVNNLEWKKHEFFTMFKDSFDEDRYEIFYNVSARKQIKMTVVIAEKNLISRNYEGVNNNCYFSFFVKNTDLQILAIHAHNSFELRSYLDEKCDYHPNIMLGDFNAGNYIKEKTGDDCKIATNRKNYLMVTEGYIDICQGKVSTTYNTQIDHILLKNSIEFITHHEYTNVIVDQSIKFSDHYPIVFRLNINED